MHSATDSCRLIKAIAILATPPGKAAQAEAFINVTPLRDCASYGHNILSGKFALPPLPKLQP